MTTIDWLRHGQTTANVTGRIQGQLNTDVTTLTAVGRQQAAQRHQQLDLSAYDRIRVSPLRRTRETAAIVTAGYTGPVTTDDRLLEAAYGDWTGQLTQDLQTRYPAAFEPLTREVLPVWLPRVGGESYLAIQRRLGQLLAELVVDHPTDHVLLISHGLTIKNAALLMLAAPATMALPEPTNLSLTRTRIDPVTGHRYLLSYSEGL